MVPTAGLPIAETEPGAIRLCHIGERTEWLLQGAQIQKGRDEKESKGLTGHRRLPSTSSTPRNSENASICILALASVNNCLGLDSTFYRTSGTSIGNCQRHSTLIQGRAVLIRAEQMLQQEGRPMAVCLGADHVCLRVVGRTLPSGEKKVGGSCVQMTDSKNGPLRVGTRLLTCSDWRPTKNTSLQGLPAATLR